MRNELTSPDRESPSLTADCTVDAAIEKSPAAAAVLDSYNIDTCCGGKASVRDAALHAHVDPAVLIGALNAASNAEPTDAKPSASCSCGCR